MLRGMCRYGSLFERLCYFESGDAVIDALLGLFLFFKAMNIPCFLLYLFQLLICNAGHRFKEKVLYNVFAMRYIT